MRFRKISNTNYVYISKWNAIYDISKSKIFFFFCFIFSFDTNFRKKHFNIVF